MKKQIVFVDYVPNIIHFKIARTLKLKGDYETVLISFSEVDKDLYSKAFDKILCLEITHKINPKNLINIFKKITSQEGKTFIREIKSLDPYLFQITGPDLFTMFIMSLIKNKPRIYFAYDIWAFYNRKFSIKDLGIKEFFQRNFEKICMKNADGILHKGPPEELKFLKYKIYVPNLAILPGCLDEWVQQPKKSKNKELHLVHAGHPPRNYNFTIPFLKIIKIVTSQKIHFHTYGRCLDKKEDELYFREKENNKYYHFHEKISANKLKKDISKYSYGSLIAFYDLSLLNPLQVKTTMANKLFDYIEAGIPIINPGQSEFMAKIVEENKIGLNIDFNNLSNLKKILEKVNYQQMLKNVKKAQKNFSWNNQITELEKFYEKVVNEKANHSTSY
jgi:glycosyltransferase involved in cell wall biosynthesis